MAAHYGDIPTGGTEIDVLPTNATAYRVRLVVLRTRADNEILARIRTCAGSDGHIAKNNVIGVVVVQFVNGDLSRAIFIGLRFRSGGPPIGVAMISLAEGYSHSINISHMKLPPKAYKPDCQ